MKKTIALSTVLALAAIGMACGDTAPANNSNKATTTNTNMAINKAMTDANNVMNAANAMMKDAANKAGEAMNKAGDAMNKAGDAVNKAAHEANKKP